MHCDISTSSAHTHSSVGFEPNTEDGHSEAHEGKQIDWAWINGSRVIVNATILNLILDCDDSKSEKLSYKKGRKMCALYDIYKLPRLSINRDLSAIASATKDILLFLLHTTIIFHRNKLQWTAKYLATCTKVSVWELWSLVATDQRAPSRERKLCVPT